MSKKFELFRIETLARRVREASRQPLFVGKDGRVLSERKSEKRKSRNRSLNRALDKAVSEFERKFGKINWI